MSVSPLLEITPKINMITCFVLDPMHLLFNGVMLKLIHEYWIKENRSIRCNRHDRKELSRRLTYIKPYIPMEFQRKIRTVKYCSNWKATELRFFLLYCGPIVLKKLIRVTFYKHFLLLHVAARHLHSNNFREIYEISKMYLHKFFKASAMLYGRQSLIMNMHNTLHVADDVINMDCSLSKISTFCFESYLGYLRNLVRTPNKPMTQICRRLKERENFQLTKPQIPVPFIVLQPKKNGFTNIILVQNIRVKNFFTITTKRPDNCTMDNENRIILLDKIFFLLNNEEKIQFSGIRLDKVKSIYTYPEESVNSNLLEVRASNATVTIDLNLIQNKMVFLSVNLKKK